MNNHDKEKPAVYGMSTLERPQFNPGQLLDDEDLNAGVSYTRDLTRLLFRSLFGCGVICGLQVQPQWACGKSKWSITVTKGLALDCMGNPIELPKASSPIVYPGECEALPDALWVTICYTEKCCRPKDVACSQDDDAQPKPTRVRAGWEIRLYKTLPKCACHCPTADDTATQNTTYDECCGPTQYAAQGAAANTAQAQSTPAVPICDCYKPHFTGECECGCNCKCVILAKITVPQKDKDNKDIPADQQVPTSDTSMVRRIRPLLNGYVDCGSPIFVDPNRPGGVKGITKPDVVDHSAQVEQVANTVKPGPIKAADEGEVTLAEHENP